MKSILHKYIFKEMCPTFLACLLVFGLIMVATRMLSITEWIINRGVHPGQALTLVFYLLPNILLFALPVAILMAVLVAFLRLSGDSEIIALNASGVNLYQMLPPVIVLSLASYLFASVIAFYGIPWGNRSFKDTVFKIVQSKVDLNIRERIFYELFDDVMFYINGISPQQRVMRDIFVVDNRDKNTTNTIVAKEGRIVSQPGSRMITVQFRGGTIFRVEKNFKSASTTRFKTYDLSIGMNDIMSSIAARKKGPKEMYVGELIHRLNREPKGTLEYNEMLIDLLEKFSIPLAVLFMGLIGAPLGAHIRSRTRSVGVVLGLLIFLIYYMCLMGARSLCETGTLSPYVGIWVPNLFLLICCITLMRRVASDRSIDLLDTFSLGWRQWRSERQGRSVDEPSRRKLPFAGESSLSGTAGDESAWRCSGEGATGKLTGSETGRFVGNRQTRKFHKRDAECGARIAPENRIVFDSRKDALGEGYVPCKRCKG